MENLSDVEKKIKWAKYYEITDPFEWDDIAITGNLTEDFIEEFYDKLNPELLSMFSNLSTAFLKKHVDDIYWNKIIYNRHIQNMDEIKKVFPDKF